MAKPNQPPQQAKRRDPARNAAGKAVLAGVAAGGSPSLVGLEDLADAVYYLDGMLFVPSGMGKATRAVRAEAKKRGVL